MRARQEILATEAVRQSLSRGGATEAYFPTELPALVEILLDEHTLWRQRQFKAHAKLLLWGLWIGVGALTLFDGSVVERLKFDLDLPDLAITGIQLAGIVGFLVIVRDIGRQMRGARAAGRIPRSALHRQADAALTTLFKTRADAAVTHQTLPALVRLIDRLERSRLRDDRQLAHAAAFALRQRLPWLAEAPIQDPAVLRFLRDRVAASAAGARAADPAFDTKFVVASLLALGEAGDREIVPTAEALARAHPSERVRAAAAECLRTQEARC